MRGWAARLGAAGAVLALLLSVLGPASAGSTATIGVEDNVFRPKDRIVALGTAVTWEWRGTSTSHNVVEDHALFTSGVPTSTPGTVFTAAPSAGSFHYVCETHEDVGMRGTVHVAPSTSAGPAGRRFDVEWASPATTTGSAFDVRYRVGRHPWRDWLTDTSQESATFGAGGMPVGVEGDTRYRFRVRSQKDFSDPAAVSLWSPVVVVAT